MASVASETFTSTSAPIQFAAVRVFEGGLQIERYLTHARRVLSAIGRWIAHRMQQPRVRCDSPAGGFYLFPDFCAHRERLAAAEATPGQPLSDDFLRDHCHRVITAVDAICGWVRAL